MDWHTTEIPVRASVVGVDFETTGLDPTGDRVVCIGIASVVGRYISYYNEILVNPHQPTRAEAQQVNGITDDMLAGAVSWSEARRVLADATEGALVVAHRLPFEAAFWKAEDDRAGLRGVQRAGMCTKLLAAAAGLRGSETGLRPACSAFGVNPARALAEAGLTSPNRWHSALWDAVACALLARRLMDYGGPLGGPDAARSHHDRLAAGGMRSLRRCMRPSPQDVELYSRAAHSSHRNDSIARSGGC